MKEKTTIKENIGYIFLQIVNDILCDKPAPTIA